ncbi:MAG: polyphosphate kinase 2 family protein [Acidobacteriaceae bacterium]|nr:polyphosphate kinase 2 family protein [Acidobacteriaceae bacterium]MBV9779852.1 polyphosphate kinase 2 family protein [Acidobacteriaceae bacterium]
MNQKLPKPSKLIKPYCVKHGKDFLLKDVNPADTQGLDLKDEAEDVLEKDIQRLSDLQQKLYAQDRWALLVILQAMDAGGKDSVVKHVMSGVNPQGCQVFSFKQPSQEDLNHDFLWRASKLLPQRGQIGIFNRSYYEDVLIVRVHPELLQKAHVPPSLVGKEIWKERFKAINSFESYLDRNGVLVRKFFLYISKEEQRKRFLSRLDEPDKNWKFSENDVKERERWDDYMEAYEDMIRHTATPRNPWFVIPGDHKWFTRMVVASVIVDTLDGLHLTFPRVDAAKRKELNRARELLTRESR